MSIASRNVRLGIVYRGSIIREEIIDRSIDVSIGLRADSTVQIAPRDHPEFPDHLDLLMFEGGKYYLVVPDDPRARVNLRGASSAEQVVTLRGKRAIPVEGIAGGSLVVGDVSVMFQFVRAYTTPTVTHERTTLRIGLVFDERLISDRIFPHDRQITIGASKNDTVVLDTDDYKGGALSFVNNKDGSVNFKAASSINVRIAVEDQAPRDVKDLIQAGKARKEGDDVVCHLTLGARGRAVMGPYSVLFQVVRQKVTVPTFEKRSVAKRIAGFFVSDVVWTASFAISLLLAFGIVGQAVIFQRTTGKYLDKAKQEEQQVLGTYEVIVELQEEEPPPETVVDVMPEEKKEEIQKAEEKAAKDDKPAKVEAKPVESTGKTVDPVEHKRNVRAAAEKKTIAGAFKGMGASSKMFGEAEEGEAGDVFAKRGPGGDDKDGDAPGKGLDIKSGGGGGTVEKVKSGSVKGFGDRKKTVTKVAAKEEKKVAVQLKLGEMTGGGADKGGVARIISRKNSTIQRCYETALRSDPGLSGKVTVRFVVGTAGTITTVTVLGASGGFASCIQSKFKAIRGLPMLPAPQSFTQSYVFTKS